MRIFPPLLTLAALALLPPAGATAQSGCGVVRSCPTQASPPAPTVASAVLTEPFPGAYDYAAGMCGGTPACQPAPLRQVHRSLGAEARFEAPYTSSATVADLCEPLALACEAFSRLTERYESLDRVRFSTSVCQEAELYCRREPGRSARVTANLGVLADLGQQLAPSQAELLAGHPDAIYPTWSPADLVGVASSLGRGVTLAIRAFRNPAFVYKTALTVNLVVAPTAELALKRFPPVPLARQAVEHLANAQAIRRAAGLRVQPIHSIIIRRSP